MSLFSSVRRISSKEFIPPRHSDWKDAAFFAIQWRINNIYVTEKIYRFCFFIPWQRRERVFGYVIVDQFAGIKCCITHMKLPLYCMDEKKLIYFQFIKKCVWTDEYIWICSTFEFVWMINIVTEIVFSFRRKND